jgi:hypothetical protein
VAATVIWDFDIIPTNISFYKINRQLFLGSIISRDVDGNDSSAVNRR